MPDLAPNPELLRSLGRLVRGLSALFWGLPAALIVCAGTAAAGWFRTFGVVAPLAVTGLLCFGLWQLGAFQRQERPWRSSLEAATLLAVFNFGLSPFLYWWNRAPDQQLFRIMTCIMAVSSLLFLFSLNVVLARLGAMLPDEALRHETRQYTALNRILLSAFLLVVAAWFALYRTLQLYLARYSDAAYPADVMPVGLALKLPFDLQISGTWVAWSVVCLLLLLPLSLTMALLWKTKEVILDSVFGAA